MHLHFKKSLQFAVKCVASRRRRALVGLCAVIILSEITFAQVDRSGISGTVIDSSGRLLPQAHVTVVENATGLRRETV